MGERLRDLKDTYKRKEVLIPQIERHVLRIPADDRRSDVMHPSEMAKAKWCGRHDYYRMTGLEPDYKGKAHSFRLMNTFDYGHTAHKKYQRWLSEMGILWGQWKCQNGWCELSFLGDGPECPECGDVSEYKEVPLGDPDLRMGGHSDGVVRLAEESNAMLEIKTVGITSLRFEAYQLYERYAEEQWTPDELWFKINRPFASHVRQGQLYMHMARKKFPHLDIQEIIFLYEWKLTQDVKEFVVPYNRDTISDILDTAEVVAEHVARAEGPPPRPDWADIEGKACGDCEYRSTCWGKKDVAPSATVRVKRAPTAKRRRALRPPT
jgi:hypothetical protein